MLQSINDDADHKINKKKNSHFAQVLICVDDLYIRKLACEATELHAMGLKLPYSLISTAPKEFQEQPITGKLSKNQKKKMKKKAKRQTELIKKQLEHIQQLDAMPEKVDGKDDELPKNGGANADQQNNDDDADDDTPDGPPSNEISQTGNEILNGSQKSEVKWNCNEFQCVSCLIENIFGFNVEGSRSDSVMFADIFFYTSKVSISKPAIPQRSKIRFYQLKCRSMWLSFSKFNVDIWTIFRVLTLLSNIRFETITNDINE